MPRKIFVAVHGVGDQRQLDTIQQAAMQVIRAAEAQGVARDLRASRASKRRILKAVKSVVGPSISLGAFDSAAPPDVDPSTVGALLWREEAGVELGFAEVHWADIARNVDKAGYRLEEGVPWAQTLVDRAKSRLAVSRAKRKMRRARTEGARTNDAKKMHNREATQSRADPDFARIRTVLGEMGEGLNLLGWLTSLAPKLNLPSFDMSKLVNAYLGDVQLVAEFKDVRQAVLNRFRATIERITRPISSSAELTHPDPHDPNDSAMAGLRPDDEIYFITHSEGTVVTLLGLLHAMSGAERPGWLNHVKGWMTFGSPIDKHLILWPELWKEFETVDPAQFPTSRIVWWNYSDCGDPIGFSLDYARQWMREIGWDQAFEFEKERTPLTKGGYVEDLKHNIYEYTYTRYKWPAKAHLDYWTDNDVFDHFLGTVAKIDACGTKVTDRPVERIISLTVPYVLAFLVLVASVFFLNSGIWSALGLQTSKEMTRFAHEVTSLSLLLAGTTVLARMPRIVREKLCFTLAAILIFGLMAYAFWRLFPADTETYLINKFNFKDWKLLSNATIKELQLGDWMSIKLCILALALTVGLNALMLRYAWWRKVITGGIYLFLLSLITVSVAKLLPFEEWRQWIGLWLTAICFAVTLLAAVRKSDESRSAGLWPLIGPGFTAMVGLGSALVVAGMNGATEVGVDGYCPPQPTLWPFGIGVIAFLFLWKLSVILFDLTFIWHWYIKQNVMLSWFRRNLTDLPEAS